MDPRIDPAARAAAAARATAPRTRMARGTSPLHAMLELSAVLRAVADERELPRAVALLQREACRLTRSREATVIGVDRAQGALWTLDDSAISDEIHALVSRIADDGERAVFGHALIEPIGGAPACAVLVLRRRAYEPFAPDDIALAAAIAGGVAAALQRLLSARP